MEDKKLEKLRKKLGYERKSGWESVKGDEVFSFAEAYKEFLSEVKTEREAVHYFVQRAAGLGFSENSSDRISIANRGKNLMLVRKGRKPVADGIRIIASHIDCPRIDLKQVPVYEDNDLAFFHTHYYGGIKKYQWANIPLEIRGTVIDKDGKAVSVRLGQNEGMVFVVPDLCPHLSHKAQDDKKATEVITGENLSLLAASIPEEGKGKDRVKLHLLKLLNEKYGIVEEDLISSELEAVPAMSAMDLGIDRSMIAAYGQDDRICAFTSCEAFFDVEEPEYTAVVFLADKEEIGSEGSTGMNSLFLIRGLYRAARTFGEKLDEGSML
ncbi:MAG TPA: aminopeptidase, partial [Nitrospirae bacterium]|nr:aminopeptidase [Nitrospirota bacterium]